MEAQKSVPGPGRKRRKTTKPSTGFKKAPQAPKRFKSPYILFSISKMQKYRVLYKNAKVTSFSSLISKEWKALTEEEKQKWKVFAEQDKLRYNTEMQIYKGPWQVPSQRLRKDPRAPKRPPSAFLNYSRTRRAALIEKNPHVKNTDISKLLGKEWRAAPQEVRQPHIDKEAQERAVYHEKILAWRKQQLKSKEAADPSQSEPLLTKDRETFPQASRPSPALEASTSHVLSPSIPALPIVTTVSSQRPEQSPVLSSSASASPIDATVLTQMPEPKAFRNGAPNPGVCPLVLRQTDGSGRSTECASLARASGSHGSSPPCAWRSYAIPLPQLEPRTLMEPRQSPTTAAAATATATATTNTCSHLDSNDPFRDAANPMPNPMPNPNPMPTISTGGGAPVVTPLQQPRKVCEYQNLFFPGTYEDRDSSGNNVVEPADLDLLFDSASEEM